MTVFACAGCDAVLTVPMSRVALPAHAGQRYGHDLLGAPVVEPGTYAVDTDTSGPIRPRPTVVMAPGDIRGAVILRERIGITGCCGFDGGDGPNLACARCGRPVATRLDDCGLWPAVRLDLGAVRQIPGQEAAPLGWETWRATVEPYNLWEPRWSAAAGMGLARLVAATGGARPELPDGPVAEAFRRSIERLFPAGGPVVTVTLAGPGLPPPTADLALVPVHPQTGEPWPGAGQVPAVALEPAFWAALATSADRHPIPVPAEVWRDERPPDHGWLEVPDRQIFLTTLAQMSEQQDPWLRAFRERIS